MSLLLEHFNTTGKTIYALIFNEAFEAYRVDLLGFGSYSDTSIAIYDIPMAEDAFRLGYYSVSVNSAGITKGTYIVEVYSQAGASPNKNDDLLAGVEIVKWNGVEEIQSTQIPEIKPVGHNGSYDLDTTGFVMVETTDKYGIRSNLDAAPQYQLYENNNSTAISGTMSSIDTGLYSASIPFTSGTYFPVEDYHVFVTGYINNTPIESMIGVDINYAVSIGDVNFDVLSQLGYASGIIETVTDAGEFTTSLPASQDDFYNGQILRFTDTSLKAQARIIRDYTGLTGRVQTNIDFVAAPATGASFVIFPIGGELNL